jgi:hypothetical protein
MSENHYWTLARRQRTPCPDVRLRYTQIDASFRAVQRRMTDLLGGGGLSPFKCGPFDFRDSLFRRPALDAGFGFTPVLP